MPVSDPEVSCPRLIRDATFLETDRQEIVLRHGPHNRWASRTGCAYRVALCVCSAPAAASVARCSTVLRPLTRRAVLLDDHAAGHASNWGRAVNTG